ncbi:GNAT family N-acetyltransferase [Azospirillum thermophilum]|uniref:N-acetyltransferase n=1 Tax=Azospirillum thermophilum TaxID=2202148 RepID=A0A2S2CP21_9PROT|nr:GNAT family N-acetyltransferase [Azospirillum thermophilum]AWK86199.1 N-acetyltransferase [Azospirillum thermophilum]
MPKTDGFRIAIRAAVAGDAPRCAEIFLNGRRRAFPWQPPDRFRLEDYDACVHDEEVLVAEVEGRVVGFVSIDRPDRFINALFIDPGWCNRGIGSALLREALGRLEGTALLSCAARNAAARAFYENQGWTPVPPPGTTPSGEAEPLVLYRMSRAG